VVKNNLLFSTVKKLGVVTLLAFFIYLISASLEDKSYFKQIYNEKLYNEPITCLSFDLTPFNQDLYNYMQILYTFNDDCDRTLQLRYKTNIACNSPYAKDKLFHSFIELNLIKNNKTYFTLYKDLKDNDDFKHEIKKALYTIIKQ